MDPEAAEGLARLEIAVTAAQMRLAALLGAALARHETTREQYVGLLSLQYHLNRGVQRDLMLAAAHLDLAARPGLRRTLVAIAEAEALHFLVAGHDLMRLGRDPLPEPLDVALWHAYFGAAAGARPFLRIGAAVIVATAPWGPAEPWVRRVLAGPFLTPETGRWVALRRRGGPEGGARLLAALAGAGLEPAQVEDLVEGALKATVLLLRMIEWALRADCLARLCDGAGPGLDPAEARRIREFRPEAALAAAPPFPG